MHVLHVCVSIAVDFIIEGEVEVEREGERLGFLSRGSFFGESPMIEGELYFYMISVCMQQIDS